MKKIILKKSFKRALGLAIAFSYFSFSNLCLLEAFVPSNSHHEHSAAVSDHHNENSSPDSHHPKNPSAEDSCCLNLAGIAVGSLIKLSDLKPSFTYFTVLAFLPIILNEPQQNAIYLDHHPPGFFSKDVFLSPASLRAPPL